MLQIQEENPLSAQKDTINLPMEMHVVQEEYQAHPDYQCVPIQEVLRVTPEMMVEEGMDLMIRRRTRLFTRMMRHDPLESLVEILILMVTMIDIQLDLPPRIHTQKASKIKQIWETWCVQVALALSTWSSLAVPYWRDICGQAERDYEKWRKSTMSARYKHETRFLYGRKAPIPPNCDAIEALLRLELLTQFPNWLTQKATMLGCTSSHDILKMALKKIFFNEDATRFDLVEELYSLSQKPSSTMHTFAAWLEDWVTKLVAADEISAYVEPRRAMAVLSHVGKPLQASDTLFMTEWVAIFRESGLRDDVSVENLRGACLQLVVCARARARELQVDVQVERASRAVVAANTVTPTKGRSTPAMEPAVCKFFLTAEGCKFGDECKYKHPRTTGKCLRCGADGHSLSSCAHTFEEQVWKPAQAID